MRPTNDFERALIHHIESGAKIYEVLTIAEKQKLVALYLATLPFDSDYKERVKEAWAADETIEMHFVAKTILNRNTDTLYQRMMELAMRVLEPEISEIYCSLWFEWEGERRIENAHEYKTQKGLYNYG